VSTADENKAFVRRWFTAMLQGDLELVDRMADDDCRFYVMGDMVFGGWMNKAQFKKQTTYLQLAGPMQIKFGEPTSEGERVWLDAESRAPLVGGGLYNNHYVFMLRIRNGKLIEHKEYADTLHIFRVLPRGLVDQAPIPRQGPVTEPWLEITGMYPDFKPQIGGG
jgi:ketosteroid isomerase-like protein